MWDSESQHEVKQRVSRRVWICCFDSHFVSFCFASLFVFISDWCQGTDNFSQYVFYIHVTRWSSWTSQPHHTMSVPGWRQSALWPGDRGSQTDARRSWWVEPAHVRGEYLPLLDWVKCRQSLKFVPETRILVEMKIENCRTKYFPWGKNRQAYFFWWKLRWWILNANWR